MPHTVMNVDELLDLMKKLQGEQSQSDFARELGVTRQYLNDVYNRRRAPGEPIIQSLAATTTTSYVVPNHVIHTATMRSLTAQGGIHGQGREEVKKAAAQGRKRKDRGKHSD